jgi:hypothetical protein
MMKYFSVGLSSLSVTCFYLEFLHYDNKRMFSQYVDRINYHMFLKKGTLSLMSSHIAKGDSMAPTLKMGDVMLEVSIPKTCHNGYKKGEIVTFKSNEFEGNFCKRIKHLENEEVIFKDKTITIPKDHIWVEGDNPSNSYDSRHFGPIHIDSIFSRVLMIRKNGHVLF